MGKVTIRCNRAPAIYKTGADGVYIGDAAVSYPPALQAADGVKLGDSSLGGVDYQQGQAFPRAEGYGAEAATGNPAA